MVDLTLALAEYANAHCLGGLVLTGATSPAAVNGPWAASHWVNGKVSYRHTLEGYALWWAPAAGQTPAQWRLATTVGGTARFTRSSASPVGSYVAVAPNTGTLTVAAVPCWANARLGDGNGDATVAQMVLTEYAAIEHRGIATYRRRSFQAACYWPSTTGANAALYQVADMTVARARAEGLRDALKDLESPFNTSEGLTLTGWGALRVEVDLLGLVDALPITGGGYLRKAVCSVHLINVSPT